VERTPASRTLAGRLERLHSSLRAELPGIDRLAIALYDGEAVSLRTFLHSTDGASPLSHYETRLADAPWLAELARTGAARLLPDLSALGGSKRVHTQAVLARGYRSSYTRPLLENGELIGFLFCDSLRPGYLAEPLSSCLQAHLDLAALTVLRAIAPTRVLRSAVRVACQLSQVRDEETGAHLHRMARYSRLIARRLAAVHGLTEEFVEFVYLFAPAHDVGKVGIPDRVLLKPARLSADEADVMHAHVIKGGEIVDAMVREFGVGAVPHVPMLRHIVLYHHEAPDGSGYPFGLRGDEFPLEARIVAVADVFDALTSERPYKPAWSTEDAFAFVAARTPDKFDAECVAALTNGRVEVEEIRSRYREA
jgi:HD-GYP domain-containing protein (c-di-GMP phosphodiesterase class II)